MESRDPALGTCDHKERHQAKHNRTNLLLSADDVTKKRWPTGGFCVLSSTACECKAGPLSQEA